MYQAKESISKSASKWILFRIFKTISASLLNETKVFHDILLKLFANDQLDFWLNID